VWSSEHALFNVEGALALAFVLALLARSERGKVRSAVMAGRGCLLALLAIAAAATLAFAPILSTPFLFDDYRHIADAAHSTAGTWAHQFAPLATPGLFFRPVGFFLYWLNYLWAGPNPLWWHFSSIALHVLCACLVYALCREFGVARFAGLIGALAFTLTGAAAETVAWIDARFDLMATALVLAGLCCVCRFAANANWLWLAGGLALGLAAMLCKESAFCLPLLIACLAWFRSERRRIWQAAAWAAILAALLFAYRWWALHGIGGYGARFHAVRTVEALLLRQWAILFFPFNWSAPASRLTYAALAAVPLLLAACAWMARPRRRALLGSIAFIIAAALPVQHLLLLGPDLGGSRELYLVSVGWALLWAVALDGMPRRGGAVVAGLLLACGAVMLEHNLTVWRDTSAMARAVCADFGRVAARISGPVVVRGLPASREGAVFLHNGFPQCVEMNSGVPAERIQTDDSAAAPPANVFRWSQTQERIEPAQR
jgi:protein O-mannosyl-transferase